MKSVYLLFYEADEKKENKKPESYDEAWEMVLKKWKISGPEELDEEQKEKFYQDVDEAWVSKKEKAGKEEEVNDWEV